MSELKYTFSRCDSRGVMLYAMCISVTACSLSTARRKAWSIQNKLSKDTPEDKTVILKLKRTPKWIMLKKH